MMHRIPFADPSPDREDHVGEPNPPQLFVTRPKAAFQWPPDCLWPFVGRKGDNDS
jgi:hypothetical protein